MRLEHWREITGYTLNVSNLKGATSVCHSFDNYFYFVKPLLHSYMSLQSPYPMTREPSLMQLPTVYVGIMGKFPGILPKKQLY